jgi:hypothetical protein
MYKHGRSPAVFASSLFAPACIMLFDFPFSSSQWIWSTAFHARDNVVTEVGMLPENTQRR